MSDKPNWPPPNPPPPRIGGQTKGDNPTAPMRISGSIDQGLKNKQLGAYGRFQLNQSIERRGGLRFNYAPLNNTDSTKNTVKFLPFFENPTIIESRRANYANTPIYLRNEPVRLWTGAEPRKFKVDVHYTLIHMASMIPTTDLFNLFNGDNPDMTIEEIEKVKYYLADCVGHDTYSDTASLLTEEDYYKMYGAYMGAPRTAAKPDLEEKIRSNVKDGPFGPFPNRMDSTWNHLLFFVLGTQTNWLNLSKMFGYIINNIRNSVISTAQFPVKGPPIVELKWGAMYDWTPCIVTDYRFQPIEDAGYDTKSLFSQRLKVSLTMEEMRNVHGSFWGESQKWADLPGWDSVLALGTMDPWDGNVEFPTFARDDDSGGII